MPPLKLLLAIAWLLLAGQVGGTTASGSARWQPAPRLSWQVQFSGPIDTAVAADVFDLDLFDTPAVLVDALHADGPCRASMSCRSTSPPPARVWASRSASESVWGSE